MTFSTGLMMVVLTGAELFTGNVMMTFSVIEKKTSLAKLLRKSSLHHQILHQHTLHLFFKLNLSAILYIILLIIVIT